MEQQLELTAPLMSLARQRGQDAGERCADKAERTTAFDSGGASRFVWGYLTRHGQTSGERLVKQAEAHGFRPHDGRAFGPVFAGLIRKGFVRVLRSDLPRERGHGTSGGRLYEATSKVWA